MITVNNLHKNFRAHAVLRGVSAEFPAGSVTAIIGPNGSGKSTLMKCILGLVTPSSGDISVHGINAIENASSRQHVGYMAQIALYPENLTAKEIIAMIRGLRGKAPCQWQELADYFQLIPHIDKPMRALSGGTRQKVGATLAMMYAPSALLLDEPTAGLDPLSAERLKEKIASFRDDGCSVLVTSHILSEIQELASRVVYLHEGEVVYQGEVDHLLEQTGTATLPKAIAHIMQEVESTP